MNFQALLTDKSLKAAEKRGLLADAIRAGAVCAADFSALSADDKTAALLLEALEALSRTNPECADLQWLRFAQEKLSVANNSVKREASRVIGNLAARFPEALAGTLAPLLANAESDGTLVRWGSAYALGRIVQTSQYANSALYDTVEKLAESETENGVKNQYLAGLKRAGKLRR